MRSLQTSGSLNREPETKICSEILFSKDWYHIETSELIFFANPPDWFLYDTSFY